ncbi:ABC transporter permease [Jiella sp. MQZ9-1]|uniref:ABC transporter permease n=1 Tax=Jiella flava TaxID=2816857 RepID=A0A939FY99_9HYPH|nr:ABC transporter permease [Jiella flava]MBO0662426.1 ABC transporter permease [Jiella flava]MCD2471650.1 ABC transporter permease [Jiella flava]
MRDSNDAIAWPFYVGSALALIVLVVPVLIVILTGLNAGDYMTFPPQGLSLRWIKSFLTSPTFVPAYLFSFGLAAATMAIATVIGTMAAIWIQRRGGRLAKILRGLFILPLVLPGVVIGLALYVFLISTGLPLARTFYGLLVGHVIVTTPLVIATVTAALVDFDRSLEDAARSLGATAWQAFFRITLPLISGGIGAGALFAFIVSFGQFEVSLFLSTPDLQPLPIAIYTSLRYRFEPTAAAAGIFAIALVVTSTVISARLVNFRRLFGGR